MSEELKIPINWEYVTVGDLALKIHYGYTAKSTKKDTGVRMLRITDIQDFKVSWNTVPFCEIHSDDISKYQLGNGDIVFARTGATVGKSFLIGKDIPLAVFASYLIRIQLSKLVNPKYVYYFFQSANYWKQIGVKALGVGQPHVNARSLSKISLPFPSFKEQVRIVIKLETLFSELDQVNVGLRKIKQQLKIYRHALLKNAFEGKLTEGWRSDNTGINANTELIDIQKSRKKRYNQLVNEGSDKRVKVDYNFVFKPNEDIQSWADAGLDGLIGINARIGWKGLTKKEYTNEGPLLLSVHALNYGKNVVFKDANHITTERYEESPGIKLQLDNILLCKDGAGIGKVGIVKNLPDMATVNSSLLVIDAKEAFNPDFLYYFFLGPSMQKLVNAKISGSAIPHLFQKDIKKFRLKVPPKQEQNQIVEILESRFTLIEHLEKSIEICLGDSTILKYSILEKAFNGKLVDRDSNDQPARELLREIKKEKEVYLKTQKELDKHKPKKKRKMEAKKTILEILEESNSPVSTQELWTNSIHDGDIESFYEEIKKIHSRLIEVKENTESLLSLKR